MSVDCKIKKKNIQRHCANEQNNKILFDEMSHVVEHEGNNTELAIESLKNLFQSHLSVFKLLNRPFVELSIAIGGYFCQ